MPQQTVTKTNQAIGIEPVAPWRVCSLQALSNWKLSVQFNDGLHGFVDLSDLINAPDPGIFFPLRDPSYFAQAYLEYGAVAWPNGADLAPDSMYKAIKQTGSR
jgi:Protein of unknown function (DUF2442)